MDVWFSSFCKSTLKQLDPTLPSHQIVSTIFGVLHFVPASPSRLWLIMYKPMQPCLAYRSTFQFSFVVLVALVLF